MQIHQFLQNSPSEKLDFEKGPETGPHRCKDEKKAWVRVETKDLDWGTSTKQGQKITSK